MKVVYTKRALRDLVRIENYAKQHSPKGAARIAARIQKRIADLEFLPKQGTVVGRLRQLFVTRTRYVAIYRVRDEAVEIVAIEHTSRLRRRS